MYHKRPNSCSVVIRENGQYKRIDPRTVFLILTTSDIAQLLNTSEAAVRNLVYRGKLARGANQKDNLVHLLHLLNKRDKLNQLLSTPQVTPQTLIYAEEDNMG